MTRFLLALLLCAVPALAVWDSFELAPDTVAGHFVHYESLPSPHFNVGWARLVYREMRFWDDAPADSYLWTLYRPSRCWTDTLELWQAIVPLMRVR